MEEPNDTEIELIKKLRENLKDLDLCEEVLIPANLVRWLRRNNSLKDAERTFRKYIEWFDDMKLESIFEHEIPKEISEVVVQPMFGFDYIGCPIAYCPVGKIDVARIMSKGYRDVFMTHILQTVERNAFFIRQLMAERKMNDSLVLITAIGDLDGLGFRQYLSKDVLQCMIILAKYMEDYYPGTVFKVVAINAPRIYTLFWRIIKPLLSADTLGKIEIYGRNREQWQKVLYELAPKESLPLKYGGCLPDDIDIRPKLYECVPKKRGSH